MTLADLSALLEQYRAGLDAEIALLERLDGLAAQQHAVAQSGEFSRFGGISDERDRVMAGLVTVEDQLKQLRHALSDGKDETRSLPGYEDVVELRRRCVEMVTRILDTDKDSLDALAAAELARREVARALERGETTLDAYRRVAAAPPEATLLNRRG
jgi:hypothetical protein